jgi:hypothetical protein
VTSISDIDLVYNNMVLIASARPLILVIGSRLTLFTKLGALVSPGVLSLTHDLRTKAISTFLLMLLETGSITRA